MSKYLKFKTPALAQAKDLKSDYGLKNHGLDSLYSVYWNLPTNSGRSPLGSSTMPETVVMRAVPVRPPPSGLHAEPFHRAM